MPVRIDPAKLEALRARLEAEQRRLLQEAAGADMLPASRVLDRLGAIEGTLAAIEAAQEEVVQRVAQTARVRAAAEPAPRAAAMLTGTVKRFEPGKRFGFIIRDDGSPDAFVHIGAVERSGRGGLYEGERVGFEMMPDHRTGKMAAANLKILG